MVNQLQARHHTVFTSENQEAKSSSGRMRQNRNARAPGWWMVAGSATRRNSVMPAATQPLPRPNEGRHQGRGGRTDLFGCCNLSR